MKLFFLFDFLAIALSNFSFCFLGLALFLLLQNEVIGRIL
ncbi:unnamed protein product, partial [Brassica oleracea]